MEFSIGTAQTLLNQLRTDFSERVANELKMTLRNVNADLDELDDTIRVVECNPAKFRIDKQELSNRKAFISAHRTKWSVLG